MDKQAEKLLAGILTAYTEILGEKLTGLYVHGSIAFGCFRWETGDVDFLAVVKEPVTVTEKKRLLSWILSVQPECPPKGLEMSVVEERFCRHLYSPHPICSIFQTTICSGAGGIRRNTVKICMVPIRIWRLILP